VLQGNFETLTLSELLATLAAAHKTGVLELDAGDTDARLHLEKGRCVAAESEALSGELDDFAALETRISEVCFAFARQSEGEFRFLADIEAPWRIEPGVELEQAIAAIDERLAEWSALEAVIPSLDSHPQLRADLDCDSLTLDPDLWKLVVAIDGRRSVREVVDRTRQSVLDVCHALKDLVEHGAVEIVPETTRAEREGPDASLPPRPPTGRAAEITDPWGPGVDDRHQELHRVLAEQELVPDEPLTDEELIPLADDDGDGLEVAGEATSQPPDEDSVRDRRALLRLFSALREG
jgi:hypothetical protein